MTDWPPPTIFPKRRKPHRLPRCEYQKILQPVFFAVCTKNRRRILLTPGVPGVLGDLLNSNSRHNGCEIIAAILMPDHLHVCACVARQGGDVLSFFEGFKRGAAIEISRTGAGHLW